MPLINDDAPILRVEAGPGTGKTFGLVQRVVRLVHAEGLDIQGSDVLIVAFNRVIAKDLQNAVEARLRDVPRNGTPEVRTVHALCLKVIGGDLRLLMAHEREAMLYDILAAHPTIKTRLGTFRAVEQALEDHEAKHAVDPELWTATFRWLIRHKARLLSELPGLLLDSINQGDYQDLAYRHILVDEFQDLTPGEQELFLKLRKPDGQFVALGDPRQSIYAFRGNDREGLSKLDAMAAAQGETVHSIPLPDCQRCPELIVRAANRLMTQYPPPMTGGSGETANVHVVTWPSPQAEAKGMATALLENIRQHPGERHLAMVTRRKFGYWLRDALLQLDPTVSVDLSFSEGLLENWAVREAFLFSSLLLDEDPATWRAWLGYRRQRGTQSFKASKRNAHAYLTYLAACNDEITKAKVLDLAASGTRPAGEGGLNVLERATRFQELYGRFADLTGDADVLIDRLLAVETWTEASDPEREAARADLLLLADKAKQLARERRGPHPEATTGNLLHFAFQQIRYQIATREPFVAPDGIQLQVTTLWGAKGVTADHVYILGMCNEALPGQYREDYPGTPEAYVEEQRRLLYVSLTRARQTLVLSRATSATFGQVKQLGLALPPNAYQRGGDPQLLASTLLREVIGFLPNAVPGMSWPGCLRATPLTP